MTDRPVHFYYREGCHLCEEMAALVIRDWPGVAGRMQWRDVDARAAWCDAYGERVPVLTLGDEPVCECFLDPARMTAHFGPPLNPV